MKNKLLITVSFLVPLMLGACSKSPTVANAQQQSGESNVALLDNLTPGGPLSGVWKFAQYTCGGKNLQESGYNGGNSAFEFGEMNNNNEMNLVLDNGNIQQTYVFNAAYNGTLITLSTSTTPPSCTPAASCTGLFFQSNPTYPAGINFTEPQTNNGTTAVTFTITADPFCTISGSPGNSTIVANKQ